MRGTAMTRQRKRQISVICLTASLFLAASAVAQTASAAGPTLAQTIGWLQNNLLGQSFTETQTLNAANSSRYDESKYQAKTTEVKVNCQSLTTTVHSIFTYSIKGQIDPNETRQTDLSAFIPIGTVEIVGYGESQVRSEERRVGKEC